MYTEFYRLRGLPFQLSPDPRFFFGSSGHQKAMAYLSYGLAQGEGFIVITGDVGAGKTTIVGRLLETLNPKQFTSAKIVTTQMGADDTLRLVANAFGVACEGLDKASITQRLENYLRSVHASGRRSLLVVDEVQNLSVRALEELRMLSNFQLGRQPLLQTFLVGQPQFRPIISSAELEQLRQRVIASYHLGPLSRDETQGYIEHRLRLVGWENDPVFTPGAFDRIFHHTGGVPRKVNTLCSRLLLFGFLEDIRTIEPNMVDQVVEELNEELYAGSAEPKAPSAREVHIDANSQSTAHPMDSAVMDAVLRRLDALEHQGHTQDRKLQQLVNFTASYVERLKQ